MSTAYPIAYANYQFSSTENLDEYDKQSKYIVSLLGHIQTLNKKKTSLLDTLAHQMNKSMKISLGDKFKVNQNSGHLARQFLESVQNK